MVRPLACAVLSLALAASVAARELEGVSLPETLRVDGRDLKLNGAGLRRMFFVKVYVAGLYVESPTRDAGQLLTDDSVRVIELRMLRTVDKSQIIDNIRESFARSEGASAAGLEAQLQLLSSSLPARVEEGRSFRVTVSPGAGTRVECGASDFTLPGDAFGRAVLRVWLGARPTDEALKAGLLGIAA